MNWITKRHHGAGWAHATGIQDRTGGRILPLLGGAALGGAIGFPLGMGASAEALHDMTPAERQRILNRASRRYPHVGVDAVGLRAEPTVYYSDDDIRNYQADLSARAGYIESTLRRLKSPLLTDWLKAKPQVTSFTSAKPSGTSGLWALPLAFTPLGFPALPFLAGAPAAGLAGNHMLWTKGAAAERIIEAWESTLAGITGTRAPPHSEPKSFIDQVNDLANAPARTARAVNDLANAPARTARAVEDAAHDTLKELKPYLIGGGALIGLVALASLSKSFR